MALGQTRRVWMEPELGEINLVPVLLQCPQAGVGQGQGGLVLEHPRSGRTGPASPPSQAGDRVTPCHCWGTPGVRLGGPREGQCVSPCVSEMPSVPAWLCHSRGKKMPRKHQDGVFFFFLLQGIRVPHLQGGAAGVRKLQQQNPFIFIYIFF